MTGQICPYLLIYFIEIMKKKEDMLLFLLAFLDLTVHNVKQHPYYFGLTDQ